MNVGDLTLTILLKVNEFNASVGGVTTSLNKVDTAANKTRSGIDKFSNSFKEGSSLLLKYAVSAGVVTGAITLFTRVMSNSVKAYMESESAGKRLLAALDGNEKKFKSLSLQAEQLQTKTRGIFSDELIQDAQTFLANQNRTEEQIKKTTEAAVRQSIVTGKDLMTSVKELDGTYEGVIGRMTKLDSRFGDLTPAQLKNGAAVDVMLSKYNNWEASLDSMEGKIKAFQTNLDELQEGIGEGFIESLAEEFSKVSDSANVSNESMKKTGVTLGSVVAWFAKGSVTGMIFRGTLDKIVTSGKESAVIIKDVVRAMLNLGSSASSWISKIPVIGKGFDYLVSKAQVYINKLWEIVNAQDSMTEGKALDERKYDKDGKYIGDTRRRRNSENAEQSNKDNSGSDKSGTGSAEETEKEKNALEELRAKIEEIENKRIEIIDLLKLENLETYEQINLAIRLIELQNELNRLKYIGIYNIPQSKTSADIEETLNLRGPIGPFNGGGSNGFGSGIQFNREAWKKDWTDGINYAIQISNILNKKPENLTDSFVMILQLASQAVKILSSGSGGAGSMFSLLGLIPGIGPILGGLGGLFGSLFGFAGGGNLATSEGKITGPGSGTSDSIIATAKGRGPIRLSNKEYIVPERLSFLYPLLEMFSTSRISNSTVRHNFAEGGGLSRIGSMLGGGSITIIQDGLTSEAVATRIVTAGTPGYKILQKLKGSRS